MELTVNFSALTAALELMGIKPLDEVSLPPRGVPLDPIDLELEDGIELLDLNAVETTNGLLSLKGRQILLYIQDHGSRVPHALENGKNGRKFHVADCTTLHTMRARKRFERYVVTNSLDGDFPIAGEDWQTGKKMEGTARLWVCQNCLKKLNYKGAKHGSTHHIARDFDIGDFFSTYSSFFPHLPRRHAGRSEDEVYSQDWPNIAAKYKADKDFKCEDCGVNLRSQKSLLHVHHLNGVKGDNRPGNLEALCVACHREQPQHKRMFIKHSDMQTINRLRREQGLLRRGNWGKVIKSCDPALRWLLEACKQKDAPIPEVCWEIKDESGAVIATIEVAWPSARIGVAISEEDRKNACDARWKVLSMFDALDDIDIFVQTISRSSTRDEKRIVTCVSCGQKLRIPNRKMSLKVNCPKCGSSFVIGNDEEKI